MTDEDGYGAAENVVRVHEGLVRTYKSALQRRLVTSIDDRSVLMHWLVEWAAAMHRRHRKGNDGKTFWERARGKTAE